MSANKIVFRILGIMVVVLVLAVLVWRFGYPSNYFYYSLGAAVVVAGVAGFLILRTGGPSQGDEKTKVQKAGSKSDKSEEDMPADAITAVDDAEYTASPSENDETIPVEEDYTDIPPLQRKRMETGYKSTVHRMDAADVTTRYKSQAGQARKDIVSDPIRPSILAAATPVKPIKTEKTQADKIQPEKGQPDKNKADKTPSDSPRPDKNKAESKKNKKEEAAEAETIETADQSTTESGVASEPPVPMIEDESSLTLEEINELVNAVWYRCENPYCKYTSFLTVHHLVDEKDGGSNKLDNLIVLCPYCHDLAHKNEMPEKEMREWIAREDRFKAKPDWHH